MVNDHSPTGFWTSSGPCYESDMVEVIEMSTCRSKPLILAAFALVCVSAETVRVPTKRAGAGPLFQIVRNNQWGFMGRTGRVVISPSFFDERDFFHGLAAVELLEGKSGFKWGFINEKGRMVIPARFDEVRDFVEDLAPVRVERKWGYIDTSGRMAIEPRFQAAGEFHEGLARVYLGARWSAVRENLPATTRRVGRSISERTTKLISQTAFRGVADSGTSARTATLLFRPNSSSHKTSRKGWPRFASRRPLKAGSDTWIGQVTW